MLLVIVNPVAGNARHRLPEVKKLFQETGLPFEMALTEGRGHAAELARQAIAKGFRTLIAVGGDGTGSEVVNGIMTAGTDPSEVTFSLLPLGTGNDWVKNYAIPRDFEAWKKMLLAGKTTEQDVGKIQFLENGQARTRYFFNVAGMAYDAFVAKAAETRGAKLRNRFAYLALVFGCLFRYTPQRARITFDGQTVEDTFYTINVGLTRYSGGGMLLTPHAIPDDGLLALTLARRISKAGIILNTPRFYNGSLPDHPQVSIHQARHIRVESLEKKAVGLEADGDWLGETPVEFSILEKKLKLISLNCSTE